MSTFIGWVITFIFFGLGLIFVLVPFTVEKKMPGGTLAISLGIGIVLLVISFAVAKLTGI